MQDLYDSVGLAENGKGTEAGSVLFSNVLTGPEQIAAPAAPAGPTGIGTLPAVPAQLGRAGTHDCEHERLCFHIQLLAWLAILGRITMGMSGCAYMFTSVGG